MASVLFLTILSAALSPGGQDRLRPAAVAAWACPTREDRAQSDPPEIATCRSAARRAYDTYPCVSNDVPSQLRLLIADFHVDFERTVFHEQFRLSWGR